MRFIIILFCFLISCKESKEKLPYLSYTINSQGKKEPYKIHYQHFKNQDNIDFDDSKINNKVFIANFFFTRCPSICPPMRAQLINIAKTFEDENDFLIISHTIDPKHDVPNILKNYAESTGITNNKWQFLNASKEHTELLSLQYKTNFKPNENGTDFYHSSYVALVDKTMSIRGFYNLLMPKEVELLKKDINTLLSN